ncbi:Asp23/Gls24 family envelope stress response protein [Paeniglutamicibacter antarcticus]
MPEQRALVTNRDIEALAAQAAMQTPGVLRLEPTIRDLLGRIGPTGAARSGQGANRLHEGVVATINDGIARVHLDIATDITYTALQVAQTVQDRVCQGIRKTGLIPGNVDISILAIEPANATG